MNTLSSVVLALHVCAYLQTYLQGNEARRLSVPGLFATTLQSCATNAHVGKGVLHFSGVSFLIIYTLKKSVANYRHFAPVVKYRRRAQKVKNRN